MTDAIMKIRLEEILTGCKVAIEESDAIIGDYVSLINFQIRSFCFSHSFKTHDAIFAAQKVNIFVSNSK